MGWFLLKKLVDLVKVCYLQQKPFNTLLLINLGENKNFSKVNYCSKSYFFWYQYFDSADRVHRWGVGRTFQKLSHLKGEGGGGEYQKCCYKGGITLFYSSIAFTVCVVGVRGLKFVLLHFNSSVFWVNHTRFSSKTLYSIKTLYHLYISNSFS